MATTRATVGAVAMAALLILAGCAGPIGNDTASPDSGPGDAATPVDGTAVGASAGTVEFYVSDEENAIDDFEQLNVRVTKIGFHRAGNGEDKGDGEGDGDDADPTETPEPTPDGATETGTTETSATETSATETNNTSATQTATSTATSGDDTEEEDDEKSDDEETDETENEKDDGTEKDDEKKGGWVEYEVNETVDLTELKGSNATQLDSLAAPNGSYDKVFVYVDGIEATLESGEQVNVKLPSNKLQLKKGFTVGNGQNVSFVFDISVKKAGKSGKYILKPIVSESGTGDEVEIDDVDEEASEGKKDDEKKEREDDGDEQEDDANKTASVDDLTVEFQGPVKAGKDATVKVTGADGPVANATTEVNGEGVGTTDGSGTVTFAVPGDAEKVEVTVRKGDAEAELEREFEDETGNAVLFLH